MIYIKHVFLLHLATVSKQVDHYIDHFCMKKVCILCVCMQVFTFAQKKQDNHSFSRKVLKKL